MTCNCGCEIVVDRERLATLIWKKQDQVVEFHRHLNINQCELLTESLIVNEQQWIGMRK